MRLWRADICFLVLLTTRKKLYYTLHTSIAYIYMYMTTINIQYVVRTHNMNTLIVHHYLQFFHICLQFQI